jgi:transposase
LQAHPSLDIVSRDGSSEYASAISKGAPQARQVSDRWHLVKNLAACVSVQLAQSLAQIHRREQAKAKASTEEKPRSSEQRPARTRAVQQAQHARQAERRARYEQMTMVREQGLKSADIAAQVGMAQRTVRGWLSRGDLPYSDPRRPRASLIDPYKTYLLARWHQGCRKGSQLERELRAKGYKGSQRVMYRYLATLDPSASKRGSSVATRQTTMQPNPLLALSAQQTTWLFFRKQDDLKEEERESLQQLRQASPPIEAAYQLVKKFLQMVADAHRRTA